MEVLLTDKPWLLYKRDDVPGGGDVGVAYCEVKYLGAHEDLPSITALERNG